MSNLPETLGGWEAMLDHLQCVQTESNSLEWLTTTVELPRPLQLHRHYKGGLYVCLGTGRMSEQRDVLLTSYWSVFKKTMWFRPPGMFTEEVEWPDGKRRPRFTPVTEIGADELAILMHVFPDHPPY